MILCWIFLFALEFFPRKILAFTAGRFSSGIFVLVEVFHAENFSFEVGCFSLEEIQFQILGEKKFVWFCRKSSLRIERTFEIFWLLWNEFSRKFGRERRFLTRARWRDLVPRTHHGVVSRMKFASIDVWNFRWSFSVGISSGFLLLRLEDFLKVGNQFLWNAKSNSVLPAASTV